MDDPQDAILELVNESLECDVPLLWIIDPFEETIEVHRPGHSKSILGNGDELVADWDGPPLRFPMASVFE